MQLAMKPMKVPIYTLMATLNEAINVFLSSPEARHYPLDAELGVVASLTSLWMQQSERVIALESTYANACLNWALLMEQTVAPIDDLEHIQ